MMRNCGSRPITWAPALQGGPPFEEFAYHPNAGTIVQQDECFPGGQNLRINHDQLFDTAPPIPPNSTSLINHLEPPQPLPRRWRSMDFMTCYFWLHGYCRYSDAECEYAHRDTGVYPDRPQPPARGYPAMAGNNLANVEAELKRRANAFGAGNVEGLLGSSYGQIDGQHQQQLQSYRLSPHQNSAHLFDNTQDRVPLSRRIQQASHPTFDNFRPNFQAPLFVPSQVSLIEPPAKPLASRHFRRGRRNHTAVSGQSGQPKPVKNLSTRPWLNSWTASAHSGPAQINNDPSVWPSLTSSNSLVRAEQAAIPAQSSASNMSYAAALGIGRRNVGATRPPGPAVAGNSGRDVGGPVPQGPPISPPRVESRPPRSAGIQPVDREDSFVRHSMERQNEPYQMPPILKNLASHLVPATIRPVIPLTLAAREPVVQRPKPRQQSRFHQLFASQQPGFSHHSERDQVAYGEPYVQQGYFHDSVADQTGVAKMPPPNGHISGWPGVSQYRYRF